jgi:hypothetical protein
VPTKRAAAALCLPSHTTACVVGAIHTHAHTHTHTHTLTHSLTHSHTHMRVCVCVCVCVVGAEHSPTFSRIHYAQDESHTTPPGRRFQNFCISARRSIFIPVISFSIYSKEHQNIFNIVSQYIQYSIVYVNGMQRPPVALLYVHLLSS